MGPPGGPPEAEGRYDNTCPEAAELLAFTRTAAEKEARDALRAAYRAAFEPVRG
jgi:hypothetical protein